MAHEVADREVVDARELEHLAVERPQRVRFLCGNDPLGLGLVDLARSIVVPDFPRPPSVEHATLDRFDLFGEHECLLEQAERIAGLAVVYAPSASRSRVGVGLIKSSTISWPSWSDGAEYVRPRGKIAILKMAATQRFGKLRIRPCSCSCVL